MALIRPDFWMPPLPDFILGLVDHTWQNQFTTFTPVSPLDYIFPILIVAVASGLQCWLLVHMLRKGIWRSRQDENSQSTFQSRGRAARFFFVANIALAIMFGLGGILSLANTLFRIWAFRLVHSASTTLVKVHPTVCSSYWCLEVPESIGKLNQGLELAFSAVMQSLILVADFLLVVRCYVVFPDKFWVWTLAAFPFALSVDSTIAGIVVIISARNSFDGGAMYYSYHFHLGDSLSASAHVSPLVSTASSVLVNLIVTTAIVTRILHSRRRMSKLVDQGVSRTDVQVPPSTRTQRTSFLPSKSFSLRGSRGTSPTRYHTTTSALLIESAVPSAICGVLACVIQPDFLRSESMAVINARYTLRMLWVTFTVGAPQLILLRVMNQRDAHTLSQTCQQEASFALSVIEFSDTDSANIGLREEGA